MAKTPALTIPSSKVVFDLTAGSTEPTMKEAGAKSVKAYRVPVDKIVPLPDFNVRVDTPEYKAHMETIAQSIEANGFDETKALAGFVHKSDEGNIIYVTDGYTRLGAVKIVNARLPEGGTPIDMLPVLVRSPAPSISELTVALHTNNTGRPLTPFELGVVVKRLLRDESATKESIAKSLAVTPRYLDDVLLLVNAPKLVRTAVLDGNVSSTLAIQELRKAGDEPKKAEERIAAAVDKAKASGKAKATAKDVGVKMKTIKSTVSVADGTDMKEIVKAVAGQVRAAIEARSDGEGDDAIKLAAVDGTIVISIQVPAPEKAKPVKKADAAKAAKSAKTAELKEAAKAAAEEGTAEAKKAKPKPAEKTTTEAKKKPAAKKAKAPAVEDPAPEGDEGDDDLGIEGAVATTDDGLDDEPAIMPPSVGGLASDEEVDI